MRIYTLRGFESGACWIGAGINRYEDELEYSKMDQCEVVASVMAYGCNIGSEGSGNERGVQLPGPETR